MKATKALFIAVLNFLCAVGFGQTNPVPTGPIISLTGPATINPGDTPTFTVSLQNTGGNNVSSLEFGISLPTGAKIVNAVSLISGITGPNKFIVCSTAAAASGPVLCMMFGFDGTTLSNTPIGSDGAVANLAISFDPATPTGTWNFNMTNLFSGSTTGLSVPLTASATTLTAAIGTSATKCDVTGDGIVNSADVIAIASEVVGNSACTFAAGCNFMNFVKILAAALPGGSCTIGQ